MLGQLTFLRFIAATGVVIFHFGRKVSSLEFGASLWSRANTAVSFFFVLSGFILACVYQKRGIRRVADFYVARLARICPLYWLALFAIAAHQLHKHGLRLADLALSASLLQSWIPGYSQVLNVPGWSLSVELFFYLSFPFLLRTMTPLRSRAVIAVAGGVWLLSQASFIALCASDRLVEGDRFRDFVTYGPVFHFSTFLVGLAGGLLFVRHRERLQPFAVPLMLATLGTFLAFVFVPNPIIQFHHDGLFAPLFVLFLCGFAAAPTLGISRLFSRPTFVLLGEASYWIYTLQGPVALVHGAITARMALAPEARFWSFYVGLTLISVACFRWIEMPLRAGIKAWYGVRTVRSQAVSELA